MKHRILAIILALCMAVTLLPGIRVSASATAKDISSSTVVSGTGFDSFDFLTDTDIFISEESHGKATIRLQNSRGIGSLYLLFDWEYGEYTIQNNADGRQIVAGQEDYLHEFVDISGQFGTVPTDITLHFEQKVHLTEIYIFSEGETPDFVQKWDAPHEGKADMVLFSTHGDDEQLFFAGLLPYYAVERDLNVQVVYMTDHRKKTTKRTHEMLNGLWAVGIRAYPVFGGFSDFRVDDMELTYIGYKQLGVSKDDILSYVVEQIRRFKPIVAVGHDINGEYSHGMHMVYTDCLIDALEITADETKFPESAKKYGVWDIPKTYLHLYGENPIVIDYDKPLASFDGMTAFQVTQQLGFPCHISQHKTRFYRWIYGEEQEIHLASQITEYSPCQFGLYRSTVGPDVQKNDFMENVHGRAEQERLEQERLEQERLEQERLEQERLEQERLEQERLEQAALRRSRNTLVLCIIISAILVALLSALIARHSIRRKQKRHKRRRRRIATGKSHK